MTTTAARRPVNVLELRDTHDVGGPGKTILETFRAIDAARFRVHLAIFLRDDEAPTSPFVTAAREYGMPVHVIRGSHQYDPRMIRRTADLVRRLGIDIVHAHEVKSDVIACLARRLHQVHMVTTLHGWIGNSARQRALIALDRWIVRRFDRVIAVSARIRDEALASGVAANKVRLVHNAIVLDNYRRSGATSGAAAAIGGAVDGPVLVSIGRLSAEKGHADLVDAVADVKRRGRTLTLVLVGDGPERAALEQRVAALGLNGAVRFPGYLDRPQRILEAADLMVLPSHTEGLPNAALEALAMEVPVLATRVGGTPEVVTDGEHGRLVPPRAPAALADGIDDFLRDPQPWKRMAQRGRAMVEQRFDFQARTRAMEDIYRELVEGGRS